MPVLYQIGIRNAWERSYVLTYGFRKTRAGADRYASELRAATTRLDVRKRICVIKLNVPEPTEEEEKKVVRRRIKSR